MLKRLLFAALVGLPLAAVTATVHAGPESEDRPLHQRERVAGIVESEQGNILTVRTRGGESVDVHWSSDTVCYIDGEEASCDRIEPGNGLAAGGAFAGDSGQFHAEVIRARTHVRPQQERVAGVVVRDGEHVLGVRTRDGQTVLVQWTDETRCGTREQQIDCERIGLSDRVAAFGAFDGDQLLARAIVLLPGHPADLTRVRGIVTSNDGGVLVVENPERTVNVHYDAETKCLTRDGAIACDSIEAGSRVLAAGEELGEHNLAAKRIVVGRGRPDGVDSGFDRPRPRPSASADSAPHFRVRRLGPPLVAPE